MQLAARRGIVVAWNEWTGRFVQVVKLKRKSDDFEWVVTSVYGPMNATLRASLWGELRAVVSAFQGLPLLFGGDFNVTLEAGDTPKEAGGRDLGLEEFRTFISETALQELGPTDC